MIHSCSFCSSVTRVCIRCRGTCIWEAIACLIGALKWSKIENKENSLVEMIRRLSSVRCKAIFQRLILTFIVYGFLLFRMHQFTRCLNWRSKPEVSWGSIHDGWLSLWTADCCVGCLRVELQGGNLRGIRFLRSFFISRSDSYEILKSVVSAVELASLHWPHFLKMSVNQWHFRFLEMNKLPYRTTKKLSITFDFILSGLDLILLNSIWSCFKTNSFIMTFISVACYGKTHKLGPLVNNTPFYLTDQDPRSLWT